MLHSDQLSDRLGIGLHLKLELFQKTGSFKVRGALNRMSALTAASSSGLTPSRRPHGDASWARLLLVTSLWQDKRSDGPRGPEARSTISMARLTRELVAV